MAGIYIHVPFCASKCIYCGFYSVANTKGVGAFLQALQQEIVLKKHYLKEQEVRTIYFGGGTPSILRIDEIEHILQGIRNNYDLSGVEEITLEANPEQLSLDFCQQLRRIGINRLSIGVQSFQDHVLRFMGRRHTAQEAFTAVRQAAAAGFDNISIDLIYGVQERNDEQWIQDIQTALSLPIQHLSCYALTPEENSILYQRIQQNKQAPVDDEQAARQYQILLHSLSNTTLEHYEVSNFAIHGFESKHNSSYWNHTSYLGLGPAAHSFIGHTRQWNPANLKQYCNNINQSIEYEEIEELTDTDIYNEKMLLGLRTREGISLDEIAQRYGTERCLQLTEHFQNHVSSEYYEQKESRIRLTESGLWFADGIASDAFMIE